MKDAKSECDRPKPPNRPNLKNKEFTKWSRGESCKRDDNIVSTDWHERLQRIAPFVPVYDNIPLNMVYLLSGEYGRIWQKERDEWYSHVFVRQGKEKEMEERQKKIKKEIREAKKAAQLKIQERKERKAKEAELKTKAEAEKAEKLKARLQKYTTQQTRKMEKTQKTKKMEEESAAAAWPQESPVPPPQEPTATESKSESQGICPKGWTPVELTVQCECSHHKKESNDKEKEKPGSEKVTEEPKTPNLYHNNDKPLDTRPQESESAQPEQKQTGKQETGCECKGH